MRGLGTAALRWLAPTFITCEGGSDLDAAAITGAARRAYEALVRVLTPLIGAVGVHALIGRAVHLASREHLWLGAPHLLGASRGAFDEVLIRTEGKDPETVAEGTAAVLAMAGALLVLLIGEGLTVRLLQAAWQTGFPHGPAQEADA
jgi:hypothetical protein